jgi:hypothetical protein
MAGRPRKYKVRTDIGKTRGKYKSTKDITGKTTKEPPLISAFWKSNKVADVMLLSSTELDILIEQWLKEYVERRLKDDRSWNFPSIALKNMNEIRNTRTKIDKGWHL